jgi:hypothetical protein
LVGKPEGKTPPGRFRCRQKDNTKMNRDHRNGTSNSDKTILPFYVFRSAPLSYANYVLENSLRTSDVEIIPSKCFLSVWFG